MALEGKQTIRPELVKPYPWNLISPHTNSMSTYVTNPDEVKPLSVIIWATPGENFQLLISDPDGSYFNGWVGRDPKSSMAV